MIRYDLDNVKMFTAADFFADIFFPNRCPCCKAFLPWNRAVCETCAALLEEAVLQNDDDTELPGGIPLYTAFLYDGAAVEAIYSAKFSGDNNFPKLCAKILSDGNEFAKNYDCIAFVPMGRNRFRKRGFNQAEVFAKALARLSGLPVIKNTLLRGNETEQHNLSSAERLENAENSYKQGRTAAAVKDKRVLLSDDIVTTGATITVCANLLLQAGAKAVGAVSETRVHKMDGA
jgi:competence protein ComFC